jgi:tripartite-type tricarboxylate transporter receptor subunit TctC
MKRFAFACAAALAVTGVALAQDPAAGYPAKPIRIVVPFPAGGSADALPRLLSDKLAAKWGQPVIVENRAGAAGNIGAELVFKAEPDGYTLLSAPPPPLVVNPSLYPNLGFDASQFVPVTVIAAIPNAMLVHPRVAAKSVQEFVAFARANPDKLNYASQGSGSTSHLAAEMFKSMAGGLRITHIPYKGTAPALKDLLAGQVDLMFDNLGVSLPHVRAGKLKVLAVGSERRFAGLPDVPAMSEVLPGFVSVAWFGVVAPPKTSPAIAAKLSAAIAETLGLPDVRERLANLSAAPIGSTPAEAAAFMKQETERYRAIIRSAGVKVD